MLKVAAIIAAMFALIAASAAYAFTESAPGTEQVGFATNAQKSVGPDYCRENFEFGESGLFCSKFEMDAATVRHKIALTEKLYKDFTGVSVKADKVVVFVISFDEINYEPLIKLAGSREKVVGRYFQTNPRPIIYVTPAALKTGNTDLAHELVHHLNSKRGLTAEEDEKLARKFEEVYEARF